MANTATTRPIEVGDRVQFTRRTNKHGIRDYRGVVLDIIATGGPSGTFAIVDGDTGGRVSVAVEELSPVEQTYLAGGDLTVDADQATAKATFRGTEPGTGVTITRDGDGVTIMAYVNSYGTGGSSATAVRLSFAHAHEAAVWLNDQMTNPANDYSANARLVDTAPVAVGDHVRIVGQDAAELAHGFGSATGTVITAYPFADNVQIRSDSGRVGTFARTNVARVI